LETVLLNNDKNIPVLGLGTWKLSGPETIDIIKEALKIGYNHIDTAEMYGNEKEIGLAIQNTPREKLFITSKVWHTNLHYEDTLKACKQSLEKLKTEYLDLYLIHWPNPGIDMEETFSAFKELYLNRKVMAVGVSNFTIRHLQHALSVCEKLSLPITINQVEFHPLFYQESLLRYCHSNNINITAFCPLARGLTLTDPVIQELALKYKKTPAQITLKWLTQQKIIAIPKASSKNHLIENIDIFNFKLEETDLNMIKKEVNQNKRTVRIDIADFDD